MNYKPKSYTPFLALFQYVLNYMLIAHEFAFLMTKYQPLKADLSKYWVSTRFWKEKSHN